VTRSHRDPSLRGWLCAALLGVLVATPIPGAAQPAGRAFRIGYLSTAASMDEPFPQALRELGYVEGRNLTLEVRLAAGRLDRLPALAAELVSARVDLIVAVSPPAIQAAKLATASIPIVMAFTSHDPVERGFVDSLAHPGHNITGVAMIADEITGKRLALLREALPRATHLAVLAQKDHSTTTGQLTAAQETARSLGIQLDVVEVRDARDYPEAFDALKHAPGLFILSSPTFHEDRRSLAVRALNDHLPTLCEWRDMAEAGCLMSYGANLVDLSRRAATYVDRIARGARPGDLPIERPTRFELVINTRTAAALGVTVPQSLVLQADHIVK